MHRAKSLIGASAQFNQSKLQAQWITRDPDSDPSESMPRHLSPFVMHSHVVGIYLCIQCFERVAQLASIE